MTREDVSKDGMFDNHEPLNTPYEFDSEYAFRFVIVETPDGEEKDVSVVDLIWGPYAAECLEAWSESELLNMLYMLFDDLCGRERKIFEFRIGLEDGHLHTHEEVASKYGVSCERVRLIESKVLGRARRPYYRSEARRAYFGDSELGKLGFEE